MFRKGHMFIIIFSIIVAGCTSIRKIQNGCESEYESFSGMAVCLKAEAASSPRMRKNEKAKLYILKAQQLGQQVDKGEISDLDARVELQQLYVDLKSKENNEKIKTCYKIGSTIQCY